MAKKKANSNIMTSVVIYDAKICTKNSAASNIKKINAYVMAFTYIVTANKKQYF